MEIEKQTRKEIKIKRTFTLDKDVHTNFKKEMEVFGLSVSSILNEFMIRVLACMENGGGEVVFVIEKGKKKTKLKGVKK